MGFSPKSRNASSLAKQVTRYLNTCNLTAPRAYPEGLGVHLHKMWQEVKGLPRACLRQKAVLNATSTDKELFEAMELGDTWPESEIIQVWFYLYRNTHLRLPDSWQDTMRRFYETLNQEALNSAMHLM